MGRRKPSASETTPLLIRIDITPAQRGPEEDPPPAPAPAPSHDDAVAKGFRRVVLRYAPVLFVFFMAG
ncbi:hypothetical protein HDU93_005340, partial [Gonapodya sp. JEL0774]